MSRVAGRTWKKYLYQVCVYLLLLCDPGWCAQRMYLVCCTERYRLASRTYIMWDGFTTILSPHKHTPCCCSNTNTWQRLQARTCYLYCYDLRAPRMYASSTAVLGLGCVLSFKSHGFILPRFNCAAPVLCHQDATRSPQVFAGGPARPST